MFLGFHILALLPSSVLIMERKRVSEELRATNAQLAGLVALDSLTGIANRRALDEKFADEWHRAMRLGSSLALIMIDIDHFKQYNDHYGHHAGDECLRAIAGTMNCAVHRPGDLLARFGGEEFALLLPHTDLQGALQIAETLRSSCFGLALEHRHSQWQQVTVSIGCSVAFPITGGDKLRLLQDADAALYRAKRLGRNRVESGSSYDPPKPEPVIFSDPAGEPSLAVT